MVQPPTPSGRFFTEREAPAPGALELVEAAEKSSVDFALTVASWMGGPRLPGRPVLARMRYRFRGQTRHEWGLTSSLYRALESGGDVDERQLAIAETAVLNEMRHQGLGYKLNDGQLLMVLQHHAIPTRLIDTTKNPLAAVYFAAAVDDGIDGRLFIIGQPTEKDGQYPQLSLGKATTLPWTKKRSVRYKERAWTDTVEWVNDPPLDPRMSAQDGGFLTGGLTTAIPGMTLDGEDLDAATQRKISTLRIVFPPSHPTLPVDRTMPAIGWTVRILAEWKPTIRHLLAKRGLTSDHLFPDFAGSRRLGEYIARHSARQS